MGRTKLIVPALAAVLMVFPAMAATFTSVADGDWLNPATWGGAVPGVGDDAVIVNNVTLSSTASIVNIDVQAGGSLVLDAASSDLHYSGNFGGAGTINCAGDPGAQLTVAGVGSRSLPDNTAFGRVAVSPGCHVSRDGNLICTGLDVYGTYFQNSGVVQQQPSPYPVFARDNATIAAGGTMHAVNVDTLGNFNLTANTNWSGDWTDLSTNGFDPAGFTVTAVANGAPQQFFGNTTFANLVINGTTVQVNTNSNLRYTGAITSVAGGVLDFASNLPCGLVVAGGGNRNLPAPAMLASSVLGSVTVETTTVAVAAGDYSLRGTINLIGDWSQTTGSLTLIGPSTVTGPGQFAVKDLTISGGVVNASFAKLTAAGTLTVNGQFTGNGTVGAVNIAGGTLTLADNLTVNGNWTNTGTFAHGGNAVTFTGNPGVITGNTTLADVQIDGVQRLGANTTLTVSGYTNGTGTLDATTNPGAKLAFATTAAHALPAIALLPSLTVPAGMSVDGGTTCSVTGALAVAGTLSAATTALTVGGLTSVGAAGNLAAQGSFAALNFAAAARVAMGGDWSVSGNVTDLGATFTHNDHTITFTGATTYNGSTVLGSVAVATGATVDDTAQLSLVDNLTVNGTLNLVQSGLRFAGTGDQILTLAAPLTVKNLFVGANARLVEAPTSATLTVSSAIANHGIIAKIMPVTTSGPLDFGLTQMSVNITTVGSLSQFVVERFDTTHPSAAVHISPGRFWRLDATGSGFTADYSFPQLSPTPNKVVFANYTGVGKQWTSYKPTLSGAVATVTGQTNLGDWAMSAGGEVTSVSRTVTTVPANTLAASPTTITVQAAQSDGTLRTLGGDTVAVTVAGANTATAAVVDNGNGSYTATYTPTNLGTDTISVRMNGSPVPGDPFSTTVRVGVPTGANSTATVPNGHSGSPTDLIVHLVDAAGHPLTHGGATVVITITGANSDTPTVTDIGNGLYTASYTPTASGTDRVAITVDGVALAGSPFTSVVGPSAVVPANTSLEVAPTTLPADGTTPAVISVTVRDRFNNVVAGVDKTVIAAVASPSGGVQVADATVSGTDGVSHINVTSTTPGLVALTVRINGTAVTPVLHVTFRPAVVIPLSSGLHFIGVPIVPDDPTPTGILGGGNDWKLGIYDAISHSTVPLDRTLDPAPAAYQFVPGKGYWVQLNAPKTLRVMGNPVVSEAFSVTCDQGWTAVANPYAADLPWRLLDITVLANGAPIGTLANDSTWSVIPPYCWYFDDATQKYVLVMPLYGSTTTVPAFKGMWVFSQRDRGGLQFKKPAGVTGRAKAAPPTGRDWLATLTATSGDGAQSSAAVGVSSRLTRALTVLAPPQVTGTAGLTLQVVTGAGRAAGQLMPSGDSQSTFDLAVTSATTQPVTLSWGDLLRALPRGVVLEMTDLQSNQTTLLNTRAAYQFTPAQAGEERRLRLTAQFGHVDRAEIVGFNVEPGRGRAAGLQLTLSSAADVTLIVRGLGGKVVKQIGFGTQPAGGVPLAWDGTDAGGRILPAGTYVLEAVATAPNGAISRAVRTVTLP